MNNIPSLPIYPLRTSPREREREAEREREKKERDRWRKERDKKEERKRETETGRMEGRKALLVSSVTLD